MQEFIEKLIGRLEEEYKPDIECFESKDDYEDSITRYNRLLNIINQLAEDYKSRIMIDGQYCWQTCACTEKCKECNRLTLNSSDIDWYENIEDWTEEYRPRTNADFIRSMNDEELAEFLLKVNTANENPCMIDGGNCKWEDYPTRDKGCKDCFLEYLRKEVKGSE